MPCLLTLNNTTVLLLNGDQQAINVILLIDVSTFSLSGCNNTFENHAHFICMAFKLALGKRQKLAIIKPKTK